MAAASFGHWATPARAQDADVGVCMLHIDVTANPDVPLVPAARTWHLDGDGTCTTTMGAYMPTLVNGELGELAVGQPTVGCAAAVLSGTLTLNITDPDYGQITFMVVGAVVGAAVELTGVRIPDAVGAGVFVQDPEDTARCLTDQSLDEATWCGVFTFTVVTPVLDLGGYGQRVAQVAPSSAEQ